MLERRVKSWTRTLNIDDAHTLLALAEPGLPVDAWITLSHAAQPHLGLARRREVIRIVRDQLLSVERGRIASNLFLEAYRRGTAAAQIDLLDYAWALTHPISLAATEAVVAPALLSGEAAIPIERFDRLISARVRTTSPESARKTRTVLLGALERIGTVVTSGSGPHRRISPARGAPHPLVFRWLLEREGRGSGPHAVGATLAVRLSLCTLEHAARCLAASEGDLGELRPPAPDAPSAPPRSAG